MTPFLLFQPFLLFFSSSLLLLFLHIPTANAQNLNSLDIYCDPDANYTNTSPFASNLNLLLSSLSSNSSLSQNRGFYNGKIGQEPNTVYGQILCRGDSSSTECHDCINKASENILINCSSSRSAAIWYDTCQLRYSDTNFFGSLRTPFWFTPYSSIYVTDPDPFRTGLEKLMNDLAKRVESEPLLRNFATGKTNYTIFKNVYGLVQCVPDISGTECHDCLQDAFSLIPGCCEKRIGGRAISQVCGLRFEIYKFYQESKVADPAPPQPSTAASSPTNQTTSDGGKPSGLQH